MTELMNHAHLILGICICHFNKSVIQELPAIGFVGVFVVVVFLVFFNVKQRLKNSGDNVAL